MRIATWNVNSLKARLPRVEEFLGYAEVDVLCLQETKLADKALPALTFQALGYESVHHGQGQWNGVAILSRVGIADAVERFRRRARRPVRRRRARARGNVRRHPRRQRLRAERPRGRRPSSTTASCNGSRACTTGSPPRTTPDDPLVVMGDFNVAPDRPRRLGPEEVRRLHARHRARAQGGRAARGVGPRGRVPARCIPTTDGLFSYWDYRAGDFHQHRGMRIDLVLATAPVAERVTWAVVDRNARKGTGSLRPRAR